MNKNKITLIQPADFQFRVTVAGACPSTLGYKAGPTWTGHPYMAGPLTPTHIHSDWDSVDTPVYLTHTALRRGRKQWYPENTTQTWEEVPTPQGQ